MSLYKKLVMPFIILTSLQLNAQINNSQTVTAKVSGNCGMCKKIIEKAGSAKKIAEVKWDQNKEVATITYDSTKTTPDSVLKKIALAGYDNEKYLAPRDAYNKLSGCCQYERPKKAMVKQENDGHAGHAMGAMAQMPAQATLLKAVYDSYFSLKNALVNSNDAVAAGAAGQLHKALQAVPMNSMEHSTHKAWMENLPVLLRDAQQISETTDIKRQRGHFATLSEALYAVAKTLEPAGIMYYQHCPMYNNGKGANWLSKEKEIKNPYYGAQMLTCGSTIETIK